MFCAVALYSSKHNIRLCSGPALTKTLSRHSPKCDFLISECSATAQSITLVSVSAVSLHRLKLNFWLAQCRCTEYSLGFGKHRVTVQTESCVLVSAATLCTVQPGFW